MNQGGVTTSSPAGKFFPPRLDPSRHLFRSRLVNRLYADWSGRHRALHIEAQAGQGKSTLAVQFLSHLKADYAWYQLGPEDGDPVLLLFTLLDCLQHRLPGFSSSTLTSMLDGGVVSAAEAAGAMEQLVEDLEQFLRNDLYLVLDDIHLLHPFPSSLALLERLLAKAPRRLRLVLLSRQPILPAMQSGLDPGQALRIGNEELALSGSEVAALCNEIHQLPVTTDTVQALQLATEGWVMGLMLAVGNPLDGNVRERAARLAAFQSRGSDGILGYFVSEVLGNFPRGLRRTLAKLSLLQEIPVPLARQLAEEEGVEAALSDLERRNFFVRRLNEEKSAFAFHHLFQDCLRELLEKEFGQDEIKETLNQAADWYLENGQPEEALRFYLRSRNFEAAQQVLRRVGMALQSQNRVVTLQGALEQVPAVEMHRYPWLAFYYGFVLVNTDPPSALPWFEEARAGFVQSGEELGELMALLQQIHFHAAVDARHNLGRPLLERAEELFGLLADQLELPQRVNAANVFLFAYTLFNTELDNADRYATLGLKLSQEAGLENLEAEARLARCYRHIFAGDFRACRQEIELSLELLQSPRVSAINKGILQLAHLNLLEMEGEFSSYKHHKGLFREWLGAEIVDKSVTGAFIRLWDMDMQLAQGSHSKARATLQQALESPFAAASSHLRSQYLQYHAYILVLDGDGEEALVAAAESMALRAEVGGRYFGAINDAIIGATYVRLGMTEKALAHFEQGLVKSQAMGELYIRSALYAHRVDLRLSLGEIGPAHEDIRYLLSILQQEEYIQFWAWTPEVMQRLLSEAIRNGIESDYACKLANERLGIALLDDGTVIPLLKIRTLGRFEIEWDGQVVLRAGDLSDAQRQLLSLLIASPELQVHQEEVQTALWPESPPAKSRSSFDSLVSRLRKSFGKALSPSSVKHYLSLNKGVLSLENCWRDVSAFEHHARVGLAHLRRKEPWQADNAFRGAFELWQGEFMAGIPVEESADCRRQDLNLLYLKCAGKWCQVLSDFGQEPQAIRVAEEALRQDPINEALVRSLYNLHAHQGDSVSTRRTLDRYSASLKEYGFSPEEIDETLDAFWV